MTRFGNLAAIGIVVALAGIAGCKKPEEPPAETPVARLAVEPRVMEFGEVEEGAVVKKEFTVRNVGAAAFVITDILAGCPCTTGEAINPFLAPGEETAVRLSFNSDGYPGQRTQYVTVRIDDSRTPDEIVQLRGNVQPWLLIDPSLIVIREAPTEKAVRHTAQAMNLGKAPVTIESIETGEQPVRLRFGDGKGLPRTLKPGDNVTLNIDAGPVAPDEPLNAVSYFHTREKLLKTPSLTVRLGPPLAPAD